jgi:hypothetical protein
LDEERAEVFGHWDRNIASYAAPLDQLRAQFKSVEDYIASPRFRGCSFVNAATAFADETHPARILARTFKEEITQRLQGLAEKIGARNPKLLADQLSLLIDGAYISAQTVGTGGPSRQLQETADALIQAQLQAGAANLSGKANVRVAGRKH